MQVLEFGGSDTAAGTETVDQTKKSRNQEDEFKVLTVEQNTSVINYNWPGNIPESEDFTLSVGGQAVFVHDTECAAFAILSFDGAREISVTVCGAIQHATVRPQKWNHATVQGSTLTLKMDGPAKISIEIDGRKPLFLFADQPETQVPDCNHPSVRFFEAGQIHEAGEINLAGGETLYIEGGAVVRGVIRTTEAHHVKVLGRGILDGGYSKGGGRQERLAVFEWCSNLLIEGITMIDPASWMLALGACDDVTIRGIKQIGEVISSDGIDIVGSRKVVVEDCFLRNNDDCIAVKAIDVTANAKEAKRDWRRDVNDILVQRCVFLNGHSGNALEIGFETRTEQISNIVFRDCDIIGAHGEGGVFSIHLGDRATVSDITYEDIRVEHFYDKLVDFRIFFSRFSKDEKRGEIRNVIFRGIRTNRDIYNSVSLIGGFDSDHTIEGVLFEDFMVGGKRMTSADDLHLFTKYASGIVFR